MFSNKHRNFVYVCRLRSPPHRVWDWHAIEVPSFNSRQLSSPGEGGREVTRTEMTELCRGVKSLGLVKQWDFIDILYLEC